MADMLSPLEWNLAPEVSPSVAAPRIDLPEKASREAFCWPMPPYASYPAATPQTDPLPCEIVGLNNTRTKGRLTFFVPDEQVAHVQVPPARTTLPLRFEQFRAIVLTTPIKPIHPKAGDPHADLLAHRAHSSFRVTLSAGGELSGETMGHVESSAGLFLFPPAAAGDGSVTRQFIPRSAFSSFELGPRIGELLIEQHSATEQQIAQAVDVQHGLRQQKLGDILVAQQIVSRSEEHTSELQSPC